MLWFVFDFAAFLAYSDSVEAGVKARENLESRRRKGANFKIDMGNPCGPMIHGLESA
jgi:hypothetical protein